MTETTTPAKSNHILTVLVDLSHPIFADRGIRALLALSEVLRGLARAALHGSEATIVQAEDGGNVGLFLITDDVDGEGKAAFDFAVGKIQEMTKAPDAAQEAVNQQG